MDFNQLDLTELDKDLSESQRSEWNAIYASYRSRSLLSGQVAGIDRNTLKFNDPNTGETIVKTISSLVVIPYRVKILIPEQEIWYDESTQRPTHVLQSMRRGTIDYVITHIDRENDCCLASRRLAMQIRRRYFLRHSPPESGKKTEARIIAVGRTHLLAECGGFDITLSQRHLSYAMIEDLRDCYHPGEVYPAIIKGYDPDKDKLAISIKEAEPHPFDGAELRHPVRCQRASVITGKYRGGVFCRLEKGLDCMCTYSALQCDSDFHIGDQVMVAITKYNYDKKLIYGKIIAKW